MHTEYIIQILVISYIKYILSLNHDILAHAHVSLTENHFFLIFNRQPLIPSTHPFHNFFSTILYPVFLFHCFYVSAVSSLLSPSCPSFLPCTWKQFVKILFKELGSGFDEESGLTEHNTMSVGHISGVISWNNFTVICYHFSYFSHVQNDLI